MINLNKYQIEQVKKEFPFVADFGLNAVQLFKDGQVRIFTNYSIPAGCGYDTDSLEKYCLSFA